MSTPDKEVELKLELEPRAAEDLKFSGAVTGFSSGTPSTKQLTSIYFDTADLRLHKAKIAARVRKSGRRWIQTVKLGKPLSGGLSSPIEIETDVSGPQFQLDQVADDDIRRQIADCTGGAELVPCFETVMQRTQRDLTREDGTIIEAALDIGEIVAGDKRQPLYELELELKSGGIAPLYEAALALTGSHAFRFSPMSKAERGYRLFIRQDEAPSKPGAISLAATMSVEDAYQHILRSCIDQISAARMVCLTSTDNEGPHQLRIGFRRLRTAFKLFRPVLDPRRTGALDLQASRFAAAAGALRDLDVLSDEITAPLASHAPEGINIPLLLEQLGKDRQAARQGLKTELASTVFNSFLLEIGSYCETAGWRKEEDTRQAEQLGEPVIFFASEAIGKRWRKVQSYGRRLDTLSRTERHDMRKALKKFRYGLEFFASLFPSEARKTFLKQLRKLQDVFGYLNDVAMAERLASLSWLRKDSAGGLPCRGVGFRPWMA
ncbi:CHAD domain-containing protein [Pannonibacter phragmitetus]|uniref:CYTH and CHAD domain-containing protein n=1 Tax=Pannonibacter phragmitetus TaxID=121719 RepID=UPI003D2EE47B